MQATKHPGIPVEHPGIPVESTETRVGMETSLFAKHFKLERKSNKKCA